MEPGKRMEDLLAGSVSRVSKAKQGSEKWLSCLSQEDFRETKNTLVFARTYCIHLLNLEPSKLKGRAYKNAQRKRP